MAFTRLKAKELNMNTDFKIMCVCVCVCFLLREYEFKALILLCMYTGAEKLNELWIIGFHFLAVGVGIYNKQKKQPRMIGVAVNLS